MLVSSGHDEAMKRVEGDADDRNVDLGHRGVWPSGRDEFVEQYTGSRPVPATSPQKIMVNTASLDGSVLLLSSI